MKNRRHTVIAMMTIGLLLFSIGFAYAQEETPEPSESTCTIVVTNVDLSTVCKLLSRLTGDNIVPDQSLRSRRIETFAIKEYSRHEVNEMLEQMTAQYIIAYNITDSGRLLIPMPSEADWRKR
jgi:type II secretory pathway component GspD/PulD (secretin)